MKIGTPRKQGISRLRMAVLGAALVTAGVLAAPRTAEAKVAVWPYFVYFGGQVWAGTTVVVFGLADVVYATRPSWLAPGWAVPQLVGGIGLVVNAVANFALLPGLGSFALGVGVVNATAGAWFIAHAVLSFTRYRPRSPSGRTVRWLPRIVVLPRADGIAALFSWQL